TALRLLLIYPLEVIEDCAPFIGGEAAELVPVRLAELGGVLPRRIRVRRRELFVALRRLGLTLVAVLALVLLERAAGIEEPAEELLLARERRSVDAATLERVGQLACLLCQLCGAIAARAVPHLIQLLRHAALLAGERARRRLHLGRHLAAGHRHQPLRLRVDRALLLRHLLQLLQHLRESRRGRRAVHALAVTRQRRRGAVE